MSNQSSRWHSAAFEPRTLLERLRRSVRRELEAEGKGDAYWYTLDQIDQDILLCEKAEQLLQEHGIDVTDSALDVMTLPPAMVFLVKLQRVLSDGWDNLDRGGPEFYLDTVNSGWASIERFFAGWAERESEARRRSAISADGSKARGDKKTDWKKDAIKLFDPGSGTKAHRARIIRKRAIEAGFRDAEKLPKRLDRDFPD